MMKKRVKIYVFGILGVILSAGLLFVVLKTVKAGLFKPSRQGYNVVIIVADSLRRDVLGCYGGDARTPNIDWLAQHGLLMENAYSTAPCTLPSSVSMFTGNYSRAYGIVETGKDKKNPLNDSFYVNDNEKLLAEVLKDEGYDVLMDVENLLALRSNNLQGFEKFTPLEQMSEEHIYEVEKALGITKTGKGSKGGSTAVKKGKRLLAPYKHFYGLLHYLLTVPKQQHFFLLKWFTDPHCPYSPPGKYRRQIPLDPAKLQQNKNFYVKNRVGTFGKLIKQNKFSDYEYYYIKALYKKEVEWLDQRVGFIIDAVKQQGLLASTIIIFTSDHGELFGEHNRVGHGEDYYETLVHIPLIFAGPGIPQGKREKTIVTHLDLMPTLKGLLGIHSEDNMKGQSYSDLFVGRSIPARTPYFDRISNTLSKKSECDALLMGDFKLVVNQKDDRYELQLFNLEKDPLETQDVFARYPPIGKKMFKMILELRKENKVRLQKNLAGIGKEVDLDKERKKTLEQLKTLGYLDGDGKN